MAIIWESVEGAWHIVRTQQITAIVNIEGKLRGGISEKKKVKIICELNKEMFERRQKTHYANTKPVQS